jgi:hypothetical protein
MTNPKYRGPRLGSRHELVYHDIGRRWAVWQLGTEFSSYGISRRARCDARLREILAVVRDKVGDAVQGRLEVIHRPILRRRLSDWPARLHVAGSAQCRVRAHSSPEGRDASQARPLLRGAA